MSAGDVTARYSGSASRFGVCALVTLTVDHGERTVVAERLELDPRLRLVDSAHERRRPAVPRRAGRQPAATARPSTGPAPSGLPGRSRPPSCGPWRTRRSPRPSRQVEAPRDAQRHRRRVPPGVVPPRLPRAARRRRRHRQHRGQLRCRRHRPHDAAPPVGRRAAAPRARHPGRRLPLPAVGRDADAEGVDPVADDGPLPRWAGGDRPRRLPRPRRLLRRPGRLLPGRDRRPLRRRAAATSSSTTPTWPTCATP